MSQHPKLAVGEAIRIYNTMLSSSRLKPNVIHLNAILDVCARAQDLESMFVLLRSADKLRAPNNLTYTIILNALRYQQSNYTDPEGKTEQDDIIKKSIELTIQRGRLVWDEVNSRWRKGEIIMDEELMCAMGRILLLGGPKQTDALLALVAEVLDIPNLDCGELPAAPKPDGEGPGAEPKGAEQKPEGKRPPRQQKQQPQGPLKPIAGNNTVSLVMRALGQGRRTKLAAKYWDYLTQTFDIVPDRRNYLDYLDTLSTGNASAKVARTIQAMPSKLVNGSVIRRGILLCHFDTYNRNAFDNACLVFDAMRQKMRVPDAACLKLFLKVAVSNDRKFEDRSQYPTEGAAKLAYARQMFDALDRVWEPLRLATNSLSYSKAATSSTSPEESWKRTYMDRQELLDVARRFIAVSDKILSQSLLPIGSDDSKVTIIRRRVMAQYVLRAYGKQSELNKISPDVEIKGDDRIATVGSF